MLTSLLPYLRTCDSMPPILRATRLQMTTTLAPLTASIGMCCDAHIPVSSAPFMNGLMLSRSSGRLERRAGHERMARGADFFWACMHALWISGSNLREAGEDCARRRLAEVDRLDVQLVRLRSQSTIQIREAIQ